MPIKLALQQDSATPFQGIDVSLTTLQIFFTVVPSGNYAALGDPMDFTTLGDAVKSSRPPLQVMIWSQKTGGVSGYSYEYTPGSPATQSNGKFQVMQGVNAAPNLDIGAGAYPAAVLADTIVGYAVFPRI